VGDITSYRDLIVWQKAIDLVDLVYDITEGFPRSELFGLVQQMRKAAVSVPSNIAEGSRHRTAGYISRVIISLGEHAGLETQAIISERRRYISPQKMKEFNDLSTRVGQLAHALLWSLEAKREADRARKREARRATHESRSNPDSRIPNPDARASEEERIRP
jgi:four helix bundle protein